MHGVVSQTVEILRTRHDELYIIGQNLVEFWAVATRATPDNGLGVTIAEAQAGSDSVEVTVRHSSRYAPGFD